MARPIQLVSSAYSLRATDYALYVTAGASGVTITLPSATGVRKEWPYFIKKVDAAAGTVTITPAGSETINLRTSFTLSFKGQGVTLVSDGSNWHVPAWGGPVIVEHTGAAVEGASPSFKAIYGNVTLGSAVTGQTQYFKALQGLTTVGNGAAPAEVWGVYGIVDVSGTGNPINSWPVVGELTVNGTGDYGNSQANSFHGAGFFHSAINATKTFLGGVDAPLFGVIELTTGRRKADAAIAAVINGALSQSTAGAGAAFKVYDFSAGDPGFDYGLDLFYSSGSYANIFEVADIRFSSGGLFVSLTSAITANTTETTTAAGTLGKTTNSTGRASLFVSDGSKWQFLTNS